MENKFHKENIFVIKNCWKDDIFSTKPGNEKKLRKEDWCSTTRSLEQTTHSKKIRFPDPPKFILVVH